jgi:hypothetical protein
MGRADVVVVGGSRTPRRLAVLGRVLAISMASGRKMPPHLRVRMQLVDLIQIVVRHGI